MPHRIIPRAMGKRSVQSKPSLRLLRTFTCQFPSTWETRLPLFQFAINDAYCEATKSTPFRVVFGKDPMPPTSSLIRDPSATSGSGAPSSNEEAADHTQYVDQHYQSLTEVWEFVREHQGKIAERMKAREDQRRREYRCQIGDLVLVSSKFHPQLRLNRKQAERYFGPYIVHELRGANAVVLRGCHQGSPKL